MELAPRRNAPIMDLELLVLLFIATASVPGHTLAQESAGLPRLEESQCVTEALLEADAKCYTLHAEENRDASNDTTVELPVAVLEPAAERGAKDPVFYFPGGPGYSVLGAADIIAQYRKDVGSRTLVLLDHRGMTHAKPALRCREYANVSPYHDVIFTPGVSGSLDTRERRRQITDVVERCYSKLVDEGIDVAQYNSYAIAQDVEALRKELEYEQIDVYGRSTGGGTALAYLKYFPDSVRAAVLVSPWYTNLRNRAPIDEFHTLKQKYTDVLGLCVVDSERCQELLPAWFLAVERARRALDARPYVTTVETENGTRETLYFDGVGFLHTLYLFLPDVYDRLPKIVSEVTEGDYASLESFFRLDEWVPDTETPRYALGYFLAHICNDMGKNRPTRADSIRMLEREPAILGFEPPWVCAWWGTDGDVPQEHSWRNRSDKPVLSIHGQMDPCCGLRWAQHLAETMDNIQYVVLQGLGHTPDSECGSRLMASFLEDPNSPVDDSCKNNTALRPWILE